MLTSMSLLIDAVDVIRYIARDRAETELKFKELYCSNQRKEESRHMDQGSYQRSLTLDFTGVVKKADTKRPASVGKLPNEIK